MELLKNKKISFKGLPRFGYYLDDLNLDITNFGKYKLLGRVIKNL